MSSETGISSYLASLGPETLASLYNDRFTTSSVFRSLPPLAKQYIMRMAMFPQGSMIPLKSVESWVAYGDTRAKPAHLNAISRLVALHVIDYDKEKLEFVLNSSFRERLLDAVVSFGMVDSSEGGQQQDAEARSVIPIPVNELEEYAKLSWERLLHFIIGVKKFPEEMEMANMIQLLCKLGVLSADSGSSGNYSIGKEGYKFLFKDLHSQLWTLLIGYLDNCTDEVTRTELLTFIFRLGFLRIGKDYSRRTMKKSENNLVIELWNLGLLYMKKKNSSRFFVTPLAKFLTTRAGTGVGLNIDTGVSVSNPEETEEKERGFIIIETSFKFYAYTNSELQKTLIKLFVNVQALLPNMIVGKITKKSIRKAISMGISSSEILHYMETNLHPEMIKAGASFPNNVADQIRLWEDEKNRLTIIEAVKLTCSETEYLPLKEFCEHHKLLLNSVDSLKFIFVSSESMPFIQEHKSEWAQ